MLCQANMPTIHTQDVATGCSASLRHTTEGLRLLPLTVQPPILRLNLPHSTGSDDVCAGVPLGAVVVPPIPLPEPDERADIHEIIPHLFLGGWKAAVDCAVLAHCGISHVVNMCSGDEGPYRWRGVEHHIAKWPPVTERLCIAAVDNPGYPLNIHFREAIAFISQALAGSTHSVLVHCRAGASRSAAVVLAFLMARHGLRLPEAESLCLSRRPDVSPNSGFRAQLELFEREIFEDSLQPSFGDR